MTRSIEAEWQARAAKSRSAYEERQRRGSAGLAPSPGGRSSGSIVNRAPSRRTTGKHNAH